MLTKMPKVGEVLIANDWGAKRYKDVTQGEEYTVTHINDGEPRFLDDMRDECYIDYGRFDCFTLKEDDEPVGFIELSEDCAQDGRYTHFGLKVDNNGYKTIKALVENSVKQRKRSEIQAQIDALQAEMNAL